MTKYLILSGALLVGGITGWQRGPGENVGTARAEVSVIEVAEPATEGTGKTSAWTTWAERIGAADSAGLEKIYAEIGALEDAEARGQLLRLLAARWADLDPAGGLAFLTAEFEKQAKGPVDLWARTLLLTEWARKDLEAALEAISGLGEWADGMLANVGSELFAAEPLLFWKWYQRTGRPRYLEQNPETWERIARAHFDEIVALAGEEALARAAEGQKSHFSDKGLLRIVAALDVERDPQAGLRWLAELPEEVRSQAALPFLKAWAEKDPLAASANLDLLKSRQVGEDALRSGGGREVMEIVIRKLGENDPLGALKWMAGNREALDVGISEISGVLSGAIAAGKLEWKVAYDTIAAMDSSGETIRLNVLRLLWDGMPAQGYGEVADWLGALEPGNSRDFATDGLMQKWLEKDPRGFAEHLNALPDEETRNRLLTGVFTFSGSAEVDTSLRLVLEDLSPEGRVAGVVAALNQSSLHADRLEMDNWASERFDPDGYARLLEGAPHTEAYGEAVKRLGQLWGTMDPASGIAWAGGLPASPERAAALAAVAGSWARYDAYGLSEYLAAASPGPDRDTAIRSLVGTLRSAEPESAWVWAQSMADAEGRATARAEVAGDWLRAAPELARETILSDPALTDAERQTLLQAPAP